MSEKIGIYEFNLLPINEQADFLREHGVFLTNVKIGSFRSSLYSLNGFYVEAVFNSENTYELQSFKRGDRLEKYLVDIDLDHLH